MEFKVYDHVYIMENNSPTKKVVFAVIECMNHFKNGTEIYLRLVDSQIGAGWGNNEGIQVSEDRVFGNRRLLIESIYKKEE